MAPESSIPTITFALRQPQKFRFYGPRLKGPVKRVVQVHKIQGKPEEK